MKDIVVEQDVNPEVDKPSKKKQLDVGAGKAEAAPAMDWDTESIPSPSFTNWVRLRHTIDDIINVD